LNEPPERSTPMPTSYHLL